MPAARGVSRASQPEPRRPRVHSPRKHPAATNLPPPHPTHPRSALALLRPCISFFRTPTTPLRLLLLGFISFVFAAAFALALLAFLGMHLRLAAKNQTTIEAFEKAPVTWASEGGWIELFGRGPGWGGR